MAQQPAAGTDVPDFIRFLALVAMDGELIPAGSGFYESLQTASPVLGIAVADADHESRIGQAIMQHLI